MKDLMKDLSGCLGCLSVIVALFAVAIIGSVAIGGIYDAVTHDGSSELDEVPRPYSGEILDGREYSDSEITVHASDNRDCVVLLKSASGKTYTSFYVRAGDSATVGVPAKKLYVYFATGKDWYGYGEGLMFGKNTVYTRTKGKKNFADYEYEFTLSKVEDGNFEPSSSNEDEFFE